MASDFSNPTPSLPSPPLPTQPIPALSPTTSTESFHSLPGTPPLAPVPTSTSESHLPPASEADEATLLSESHTLKTSGNTLFSEKRFSEAISTYDRALASCPNNLDYEIAVLKSNVAACYVGLEEWKDAIESASEALEALERLDPTVSKKKKEGDKKRMKKRREKQKQPGNGHRTLDSQRAGSDSETEPEPEPEPEPESEEEDPSSSINQIDPSAPLIEIPPSADPDTFLASLSVSSTRQADILRIHQKSLLRRARARAAIKTWASLAGAVEDYTLVLSLLHIPSHPPSSSSSSSTVGHAETLRTVRSALLTLPAEVEKAKTAEMGEMMGKLKELGNGILRPFGLSTENFKMVRDEATGGYSMNFEGGGAGGK